MPWAVAGGLSSETLGHAYEGTPYEPAARFVGGFAPYGAGAATTLLRHVPEGVGAFGGRMRTPTYEALSLIQGLRSAATCRPRSSSSSPRTWRQSSGPWARSPSPLPPARSRVRRPSWPSSRRRQNRLPPCRSGAACPDPGRRHNRQISPTSAICRSKRRSPSPAPSRT